MIIKNHKYIYKTVAEKYNIDPILVEKIGSFTWTDLNKRISEFENREIYMLKVGVWKFRKLKGESYLKYLSKKLKELRANENLTHSQKLDGAKKILKNIRKIRLLLNEWNELIQKKKDFVNEQITRDIQK